MNPGSKETTVVKEKRDPGERHSERQDCDLNLQLQLDHVHLPKK